MNNVTYLPGIVSPVQPKAAEVATIQGTIFARLYCPFSAKTRTKTILLQYTAI